MSAAIGTVIGLVVLVLGWIIYGAIIGASKKGGEHLWENKEEYTEKGRKWWQSRKQ